MDFELTPAQEAFLETVEAFAAEHIRPRAAAIDQSGALPADLIDEAGRRGLLGVTIDRSWKGAGRDRASLALAIEEVARASGAVAAFLAVHNALVADVVRQFGSDAQKREWLEPLATGRAIGACALSETDAGAANQQTQAVKGSGGYRLSGTKVWVANAQVAAVAVVFAATRAGEREKGVTAFLVPLDAPGVGKTARSDALGIRGLGCMDVSFEADVGVDHVLGSVDEGFALATRALDAGRVAIAATAIGIGQAALDEALSHARERRSTGGRLGDHQAVQFMMADVATELDAARMLTWKAATDGGGALDAAAESAMALLASSQAARRAADTAMQVLASEGYRRGSTVERLWRDARGVDLVLGTSESPRSVIAAQALRAGK